MCSSNGAGGCGLTRGRVVTVVGLVLEIMMMELSRRCEVWSCCGKFVVDNDIVVDVVVLSLFFEAQ